MIHDKIDVGELMNKSGVKFGTSGARGLAKDMTDEVCYAYTTAFIQYLEETGALGGSAKIAIGGDLRPSTGRIIKAVSRAVSDKGFVPENCGRLPSPAAAYYGLVHNIPTIMVTGSHIPYDRNGIKYTKKDGEILKDDESGIKRQEIKIPEGLFDNRGMLAVSTDESVVVEDAINLYVSRYIDYFPKNCLKGKKVGVYQHSAVGRDLIVKIFTALGADVTKLGFSDEFVPVDTEAIRTEDVESARRWAEEYKFDSIISTDGDSDRPLISDENGSWLRGDIAGILCSSYFGADTVVAPISCNTAVEKCGLFKNVIRTKIGSPYVIEGMQRALKSGSEVVAGYEANGGFLLGSDIVTDGRRLKALPTRDAVIIHIAVLLLSIDKAVPVSGLLRELPERFTYSNRLKEFPVENSKAKLSELYSGNTERDLNNIDAIFSEYFGKPVSLDITDGLRISFDNDDIMHLRPSGNAPEFRCYTEASSEKRAEEMNRICIGIMKKWR